jgi:hypothetical protein
MRNVPIASNLLRHEPTSTRVRRKSTLGGFFNFFAADIPGALMVLRTRLLFTQHDELFVSLSLLQVIPVLLPLHYFF